MAKIQNTDNTNANVDTDNTNANVDVGQAFIHCSWEYKMVQTLWKTIWWILTKGAPKGAENLCLHKNLHADVYSSFYNCQIIEAKNVLQ
jgi:hypothetical protein